MAKGSKVVNTIIGVIGLLLAVFIFLVAIVWAAESKTNPTPEDVDIIYSSLIFYGIFWFVSISNIFTVFFQKTKLSIKGLNAFLATVFSGGFIIGIIMFIANFELLAEQEGIDTVEYIGLLSPELADLQFKGILTIGIITLISIIVCIVTPFIVAKNKQVQEPINRTLSVGQSTKAIETKQTTQPTSSDQQQSNGANSPFEM